MSLFLNISFRRVKAFEVLAKCKVLEAQGRGGLYELAKELTDKFENKYKGKEWDGEFFDTINEFLEEELR